MPSPKRIAAYQRGLSGETQAIAYLRRQGYDILEKRYKTPHGEIDIIVQQNNIVAFVEVKSCRNMDEALHAITPRQQQRIIAAALLYLAEHTLNADCRFDAILLSGNELRHIPNAWQAD